MKFRHQENGDKDDLSPRLPSVVPRLISETETGIVEIEKCHWSSSVILPGSSFKVTEKLSKDKTKLNENVQSGNGEIVLQVSCSSTSSCFSDLNVAEFSRKMVD